MFYHSSNRLILTVYLFSLLASFCMTATGGNISGGDAQITTSPSQARQENKKVSTSGMPVYRPPLRGAPIARVGGGTRSPDNAAPYITVITPLHTGYTSNPQPELFWYLSGGSAALFEFALINDEDIQPMVDKVLAAPTPGLHRLRLSDFGVTLKPDRRYQWSVAAVSDPDQRSADTLSSGMIRYMIASKELESRLQKATPQQAVHIYAEAGYWYDAFETLAELIAKDPGNEELIEQRNALLRQADLPAVAASR